MIFKAFGKKPSGKRLERIQQSPNYREGSFQNLAPTTVTVHGVSMGKMLREYYNKPKTTVPKKPLPTIKTDLRALHADSPAIVWFGHSSYMIKSKGKTILADPVFSGYASPFPFFAKAWAGTNVYGTNDFDEIDILLLTHDHYDHLDYNTIKKLAPRVKHICTSLGVASHLEYWGIPAEKIKELDWWETATYDDDIEFTAAPARHFSGRGLKRAQTLWSSFILKLHGHTLYLGGDSGYGPHFEEIGRTFGPFDIALLEAGQYGKNWPYIHMMPEQVVDAANDLNTKALLPVHWGKFTLSLHEWDEPIKRVMATMEKCNARITTPMIGEPIILNKHYPESRWWEK